MGYRDSRCQGLLPLVVFVARCSRGQLIFALGPLEQWTEFEHALAVVAGFVVDYPGPREVGE